MACGDESQRQLLRDTSRADGDGSATVLDDGAEFQHPSRKRQFVQSLVDNIRMIRQDFHPRPYQDDFFRRPMVIAFILLYAVVGVAVPCIILRNHYMEAVEKGDAQDFLDVLLVKDTHMQRIGKVYLCMIPLMCFAVPVFVPSLATASCLPYLAFVFFGIKQAVDVAVMEEFRVILDNFLTHVVDTTIALGFLRALDYLDHIMHEIMIAEDELVKNKNITKWQGLMHSVGVTRSGKEEKDKIMAIAQNPSIAHLVYEKVWRVWLVGAKLFALLAYVVCSLAGEKAGATIAAGAAWYGAAALFLSYKFWDKTATLIKLWTHKPFFVGDIVTIGDISGFVEHISMSYVVIRAFDCKQTYLPLAELSGAVIQNWTRRPTKPVVLDFSVSPSSKAESVEALVRFMKDWIDKSSEVLQTGYKKSCVEGMSHGYELKAIFSPAIGANKNKLRDAFIMAVTSKAQELAVQLSTDNATTVFLPDSSYEPKKLQ